MNKSITFGIIVYNVKDYLENCIKSVTKQKGDDIEIIIVDDGSTDGSAEICDAFARKDNRIRVIHKENGGASTARNRIIEEACGEWICFIDGDDMICDGSADIIRSKISVEYQIIFFDVIYFRNEKTIPKYNINMTDMELDTAEEIEELRLNTLYKNRNAKNYVNKTVCSSWGKVYNRRFLTDNGLRFDDRARKGQDTVFSFCCTKYLRKVLFVRQAIYLYRQNDTSIVNRCNPKILNFNNSLSEIFYEEISSFSGEQKEKLIKRYYEFCIMLIKVSAELYFCHGDNKKALSEREKEFSEYINKEWCINAIENCCAEELIKSDYDTYCFIKQNDFKGICHLIKHKENDKRLRYYASLIGLNKVKSRLKKILNRG